MQKTLTVILSFVFVSLIYADRQNDVSPRITSEEIIFSYENPEARQVKLLTSADDYRTTYLFIKKDEKWILNLPLNQPEFQLKPGRYFYKLVVDNIFITDPKNLNYITDPYIGKVSYFDVQKKLMDFDSSPQRIAPLTYRFYFKKSSATQNIDSIMFTGSFNEWRPYEYFLKKHNETTFYLDFKFPKPGTYYYLFIVDGNWILDPMNPKTATTKQKASQSVVLVK